MNEFYDFLKETPLPTILIIAGLFFLFIAIGGKFTAKIITDRINKKIAATIGIVFLVIGIGFYMYKPDIKNIKKNEKMSSESNFTKQEIDKHFFKWNNEFWEERIKNFEFITDLPTIPLRFQSDQAGIDFEFNAPLNFTFDQIKNKILNHFDYANYISQKMQGIGQLEHQWYLTANSKKYPGNKTIEQANIERHSVIKLHLRIPEQHRTMSRSLF